MNTTTPVPIIAAALTRSGQGGPSEPGASLVGAATAVNGGAVVAPRAIGATVATVVDVTRDVDVDEDEDDFPVVRVVDVPATAPLGRAVVGEEGEYAVTDTGGSVRCGVDEGGGGGGGGGGAADLSL